MKFSFRAERLSGVVAQRRTVIAAVLAAGAALATTAIVWTGVTSPTSAAGREQQFRDAGRAYSEGRFGDAARSYEDLARKGSAAEVFYNLGNAYFRDGRLGQAVLNYRKAWVLAPRDPDVAANLRLALQAAGASEADHSSAEIAFSWLSAREWSGVALAGWWMTCLGLALAVGFRRWRWIAVRLTALAAAATIAAAFGLASWHGLERKPEFVILDESQNALAGPMVSAAPRFSLPAASIVRTRGSQGEWVNVTHGQLSGWVRLGAGARVLLEISSE